MYTVVVVVAAAAAATAAAQTTITRTLKGAISANMHNSVSAICLL